MCAASIWKTDILKSLKNAAVIRQVMSAVTTRSIVSITPPIPNGMDEAC